MFKKNIKAILLGPILMGRALRALQSNVSCHKEQTSKKEQENDVQEDTDGCFYYTSLICINTNVHFVFTFHMTAVVERDGCLKMTFKLTY